ncbi:MAG: ABC transporter ATP-binding protein [Fusobacteriaceae bacterium]
MEKILEVKKLKIGFNTYAGQVQAVRNIDFFLKKGETLAIVGESGCGKTVTSKSLMRLLPENNTVIGEESEINFKGENILKYGKKQLKELRGGKIAMIFQDPMTSLNPTMKIGAQIAESLIIHKKLSKKDAWKEAIEMLKVVNIPNPEKRVQEYPHQFSGGMRQRVMIAIALSCNPQILVADEPTTALDVTIQAQIMELIGELQEKMDTAVILVTHDLGVVAGVADRVNVMYAGEIIEYGTKEEIFYNPQHPYTWALLKSVPRLETENKSELYSLKGTPPDLLKPPLGCPFADRCEYCMGICKESSPEKTVISENHGVRCWLQHEEAPEVKNPISGDVI